MEADYGLAAGRMVSQELTELRDPEPDANPPNSPASPDDPSRYYETRFLSPDEFWRVESQFREHGVGLPNPELSQIAVVEDDEGEIISFSVLQPIYHLEPFWTRQDHEHENLWERTLNAHEDQIRHLLRSRNFPSLQVMIFSPRPGWARRFKKYGYDEPGWSVLVKDYKP